MESAAGAVQEPDGDPVDNLGARLRDVRQSLGLSLREVARRLGVSPSFVSQMENGKSQPSVATLYSLSQLLGLSIDELFTPEPSSEQRAEAAPPEDADAVSRTTFGSPADVWPARDDPAPTRFAVVTPDARPKLVMDSGVIWEQLAPAGHELDFMEIVYPPGSSSTTDSRMLRHDGMEYGYLLSGELEVTVGFEKQVLRAGESMALDSTVPHLFTNHGSTPARGIWVVHHGGQAHRRDS